MITLHHLNKSRSKRIIWLLEELGLEYEVVSYQRDSQSFLAPPELKTIHPLGKSPVIEADGMVIAESAAITEYLIDTHGKGRLSPKRGTAEFVEYLQWLHFAESSAILPLLLRMFLQKDGCKTNFLAGYAAVEVEKVIGYLDTALENRSYLVGDTLSGADIMMSFIVEIVENSGDITRFANLMRYAKQLESHAAFQRAGELELAWDEGIAARA